MTLLLMLSGCFYISDADLDDRLDADGDGLQRPLDCDDDDPLVGAAQQWFVDADGDRYGGTATVTACPGEEGLALSSDDCNDSDAAVHPGATEQCNEADDDCDGEIDDGAEVPTWYFDGDSDGFGDAAIVVEQCTQPEGHVANDDDCDDDEPGVHPDVVWHLDSDGDGFGDERDSEDVTQASCIQPEGYTSVEDALDCDDSDAAVNPDAQEICDESDVDEDCDDSSDDADDSVDVDGFSRWYSDADGDGYGDASVDPVDTCDAPDGYVSNHKDCAPGSTDEDESLACNWVQVSAGWDHSCGVKQDGSGYCWGWNGYGGTDVPEAAYSYIEAGWASSCGLVSDGTIACWGQESTSDGLDNRLDTPEGTYKSLSLSDDTGCAIADDDTVECWGYDGTGMASPPGGAFQQLAAGGSTVCGLDSGGAVQCWGHEESLPSLEAAGPYTYLVDDTVSSLCALDGAGELDCWGYSTDPHGKRLHPEGSGFTQVDCSYLACCALDDEHAISCWGELDIGPLHPPEGEFESISVGYWHGCAVTTDGEAVCWGSEANGKATPPE